MGLYGSVLTIWRPDEDLLHALKPGRAEGRLLAATAVSVGDSALRNGALRLTASRSTQWHWLTPLATAKTAHGSDEDAMRFPWGFAPRSPISISALRTLPAGAEADIVGVALAAVPRASSSRDAQQQEEEVGLVLLGDASGQILALRWPEWEGRCPAAALCRRSARSIRFWESHAQSLGARASMGGKRVPEHKSGVAAGDVVVRVSDLVLAEYDEVTGIQNCVLSDVSGVTKVKSAGRSPATARRAAAGVTPTTAAETRLQQWLASEAGQASVAEMRACAARTLHVQH